MLEGDVRKGGWRDVSGSGGFEGFEVGVHGVECAAAEVRCGGSDGEAGDEGEEEGGLGLWVDGGVDEGGGFAALEEVREGVAE